MERKIENKYSDRLINREIDFSNAIAELEWRQQELKTVCRQIDVNRLRIEKQRVERESGVLEAEIESVREALKLKREELGRKNGLIESLKVSQQNLAAQLGEGGN